MEWLNQAAEIALRNLAWTAGFVLAAVLMFALICAVIGCLVRDHEANGPWRVRRERGVAGPVQAPKSLLVAALTIEQRERKAERIRYLESVLKNCEREPKTRSRKRAPARQRLDVTV